MSYLNQFYFIFLFTMYWNLLSEEESLNGPCSKFRVTMRVYADIEVNTQTEAPFCFYKLFVLNT